MTIIEQLGSIGVSHPHFAATMTDAIAEIEQLRAIVDKLPKTADGMPVVPGMRVYYMRTNGAFDVSIVTPSFYLMPCPEDAIALDAAEDRWSWYSTREAAEEAGGGK